MHHIEKGNPRDSKRYVIRGLTNKGGGRREVKELGEHNIIIIIREEPKSACRCLISAR